MMQSSCATDTDMSKLRNNSALDRYEFVKQSGNLQATQPSQQAMSNKGREETNKINKQEETEWGQEWSLQQMATLGSCLTFILCGDDC